MTGSPPVQEAIPISDVGDLSTARLAARSMSTAIGFDERAVEEIALAVRELATNLVKHAKDGVLRLRRRVHLSEPFVREHRAPGGDLPRPCL